MNGTPSLSPPSRPRQLAPAGYAACTGRRQATAAAYRSDAPCVCFHRLKPLRRVGEGRRHIREIWDGKALLHLNGEPRERIEHDVARIVYSNHFGVFEERSGSRTRRRRNGDEKGGECQAHKPTTGEKIERASDVPGGAHHGNGGCGAGAGVRRCPRGLAPLEDTKKKPPTVTRHTTQSHNTLSHTTQSHKPMTHSFQKTSVPLRTKQYILTSKPPSSWRTNTQRSSAMPGVRCG